MQQMLGASVDLDDAYLRGLVLAAIERRQGCWALGPQAQALYHWGEYERIDWGAVYAGAPLRTLLSGAAALQLTLWRWCAGRLAASSYCIRKGLIRKVGRGRVLACNPRSTRA